MAVEDTSAVLLHDKNITRIPEEVLLNCNDIRILDLSRNPGIHLRRCIGRFKYARKLVLEECALRKMPDDICELTELEELNLSKNSFFEGLKPSVGRLRRLKKLTLVGCALTTVPESLGDLELLEELDLSVNDFSNGLCQTMERLRQLKKLVLRDCKVTAIPDWLGNLKMLEELNLSLNDLSQYLHSTIRRLRRLKKLSLNDCKMGSIPEWLGELKLLEELNLSGSRFSNGPYPAVRPLRRLKKLSLQDCQMTDVPDWLGDLKLLDELDLSQNDFSKGIPYTIGRLRQLKILVLRDCKITALPDWLGDMKLLEELDLSMSNFSKGMHPTIVRMQRLKRLWLRDCKMTQIPYWLVDLEMLEELDLSNNSAAKGLNTVIAQLRRLRKLYLDGCKMRSLPDAIEDLELLEELQLSRSNFSKGLHPAVGRLYRLKKLTLSHCEMKALPDSLGDLKQLEELDVSWSNFSEGLNPAVGQLNQLKKFKLLGCEISAFPDFLGDLHMLEELDLSGNKFLGGLNQTVGRLAQLRILKLSGCNLKNVPDSLGDLELLQEMDLSFNQFSKGLNSAIGRLRRLRTLKLNNSGLQNFPDMMGTLDRLQELDLSRSSFSIGINPVIGRLRRLKKLKLDFCTLNTLPNSLGDLKLLEELDLSGNNFSAGINPSIGRLRQLKTLKLDNCDVRSLPDSLGDLKMLTELNLMGNCLTEYPSCTLRLKHLHTINLSHPKAAEQEAPSKWKRLCQSLKRRTTTDARRHESKGKINKSSTTQRVRAHGMTSLPIDVAETSLCELNLDGNPITEPPEAIWRQGLSAIKSYLREKSLGTDEVCPDTINIIGDVFAGKTSIAQSLVRGSPHPAAEEDRTRVMQQLRAGFGKNGKLLVNINDFGGHQIYHSVIPIFLPTDGLTILAYDMSRPVKDQESTVRRWLLTTFAKSKHIRVTVVGTRCDRISQVKRESLEKHMLKFTASLLDGAKHEISLHINRLEQAPSNSDKHKLSHLRDLVVRFENADISVVSLSCRKPDRGLSALRDNVARKLRHTDSMPLRWFRVMNSILHASSNRPYLTWSDVQKLYREHVPDTDGDQDLIVILRYLVSTSQVFWLENHDTLKDFIFHLPQRILKICKDVLDHDQSRQLASHWAELYAKDRERYAKGIVRQSFMVALLTEKEIADVSIEFLKSFNLISEISADNGTKSYVIPCNLPADEPRIMKDLDKRLHSCPNSIVMNLIFLGSMLPISFFETSISSILTIAAHFANEGVSTLVWRDGVLVLYDAVCFAARHRDNVLSLAAFSEHPTSDPWSIMLPIVKAIYANIAASWHGATPESTLVCPACRVNGRRKKTAGEIEMTLETLVSKVQHKRAKRMCPQCVKTIPPSLCIPVPRGSLNAREQDELKTFLTKYGMLVDNGIYQPGASSADLLQTRECTVSEEDSNRNELFKRMRKATPKLVRELDRQSVCVIVDALLAACGGIGLITEDHRQDIEAERTDRDKIRRLLRIVSSRGDEAIQVLATALQSDDVRRPDLAELLLELPIV